MEDTSKRLEIKHFIEELHKVNPFVENNIYKSTCRVNLNTILGYYNEDEEINFLEHYYDKR